MVSRYHQIKKKFPEGDTPNLNDHNFPVPGYLLSVSGHMFLTLDEGVDQNLAKAPMQLRP